MPINLDEKPLDSNKSETLLTLSSHERELLCAVHDGESVEYGGEGRDVAEKQYGSYLFTVTIP